MLIHYNGDAASTLDNRVKYFLCNRDTEPEKPNGYKGICLLTVK